MQGSRMVWGVCHLREVCKVVATPGKFVMSLFRWKSRAKINFFLVLSLSFLTDRYTLSLAVQSATFLFFAPIGIRQHELLFSPAQRCSAQCCASCFIWKEYFLFMLVKILFFSEARRFCLRKSNPLKVLHNYLHDYLKCLPWLCSELRGIDKQPAAY